MVTNVSFNLGYTVIMARILAPSAFGLIAMAQIAVGLLNYLSQLGVSPALVQKPELSERDIRAALTLSMLVNALCFAALWLLAAFVGEFFADAEVVPILRGLAVAFLLNGFSVVSMGILRRRLMFKQLAFVEIASYIVGYGCVGIGSALLGWGVWSLVFAVLGQGVVTALVSYAYVRHNVLPIFAWGDIRHFLQYGSKYSSIGFLEYIGASIDSLLIGRLFGETALGLYNRAQMVVYLPMHHIGNAITRVLFPVLSTAQSDKATMARAYLAGWVVMGSLAASISLSLVVAASDAVLTLLGAHWTAAIPIVEIYAFVVPFAFLTILSGIVCDAQGLLWSKLVIQCLSLLVLGVAIYQLLDEGTLGIAKALVIMEAFRLVLYAGLHLSRLPISFRDFFKVNAAVALTTVVTVLAVWGTAKLAHQYDLATMLSFILEMIAGGVTFVLVFGMAWLWLRGMATFIALRKHLPVIDRIEGVYPSFMIASRRPS